MSVNENEKYKDKGLTGLANLGNTCFINSCMQILSHTYKLNDFLAGDVFSEITDALQLQYQADQLDNKQ